MLKDNGQHACPVENRTNFNQIDFGKLIRNPKKGENRGNHNFGGDLE